MFNNGCLFSTDLIGCRPKSGKYIKECYEDTNHVRFLSKYGRTVNQGLLLEKHSSLEVSTTAGTTQTREGMGWTDLEDTSWDSEIFRACLGNPKLAAHFSWSIMIIVASCFGTASWCGMLCLASTTILCEIHTPANMDDLQVTHIFYSG